MQWGRKMPQSCSALFSHGRAPAFLPSIQPLLRSPHHTHEHACARSGLCATALPHMGSVSPRVTWSCAGTGWELRFIQLQVKSAVTPPRACVAVGTAVRVCVCVKAKVHAVMKRWCCAAAYQLMLCLLAATRKWCVESLNAQRRSSSSELWLHLSSSSHQFRSALTRN